VLLGMLPTEEGRAGLAGGLSARRDRKAANASVNTLVVYLPARTQACSSAGGIGGSPAGPTPFGPATPAPSSAGQTSTIERRCGTGSAASSGGGVARALADTPRRSCTTASGCCHSSGRASPCRDRDRTPRVKPVGETDAGKPHVRCSAAEPPSPCGADRGCQDVVLTVPSARAPTRKGGNGQELPDLRIVIASRLPHAASAREWEASRFDKCSQCRRQASSCTLTPPARLPARDPRSGYEAPRDGSRECIREDLVGSQPGKPGAKRVAGSKVGDVGRFEGTRDVPKMCVGRPFC